MGFNFSLIGVVVHLKLVFDYPMVSVKVIDVVFLHIIMRYSLGRRLVALQSLDHLPSHSLLFDHSQLLLECVSHIPWVFRHQYFLIHLSRLYFVLVLQ